MLARRVIPCLEIEDGRLRQAVRLQGLRDVGDPVEVAARYDAEGADELHFDDVTASSDRRGHLVDLARRVGEELFIPFSVGGGLQTLDDVAAVLGAGADKVRLNAGALERPELITEVATRFGSQSVVVAVELRRVASKVAGEPLFELATHGTRGETGRDGVAWVLEAVGRGAGEILLTSIDADGGPDGYDFAQIRQIADAVRVPVIGSLGVGTLDHLVQAVTIGGVSAVMVDSMFHFGTLTISQVKEGLRAAGEPVRLVVPRASRFGSRIDAPTVRNRSVREDGRPVRVPRPRSTWSHPGRATDGRVPLSVTTGSVPSLPEPPTMELPTVPERPDGVLPEPNWGPDGLLPVIVQDIRSGKVLTLAWTNAEGLARTESERESSFWSRSRQELWNQGATSGETPRVHRVSLHSDGGAILVEVTPSGPDSQAGADDGMFQERLPADGPVPAIDPLGPVLRELREVVDRRKERRVEGSYASYLFDKGLDRILKKVGEEATEVIIAAKNADNGALAGELANLLFHLVVLMADRDLPVGDVATQLAARRGPRNKVPGALPQS